MKKTLLSILMFAAVIAAQSQTYYQLQKSNDTSSVVLASATKTNTSVLIPVKQSSLIGFEGRFKLTDAGTDDVITHFDGSVSGSTWTLDVASPLVIAGNGTSFVSGVTNIDPRGFTTIRVRIENGNSAAAVTNLSLAATLWSGTTTFAGAIDRLTLTRPTISGQTNSDLTASRLVATDANKALSTPANPIVGGNLTITGNVTNSALTASLPVFTDAGKALVSKTVANTKLALGIQSGTAVTAADGTVTNTFASAFSARPVVVATQYGELEAGTNWLTSVTTSNFVIYCGGPGVTNMWIAIGAP